MEDGVGNAVVDEHLRLPCAVAVALADAVEDSLNLCIDRFAICRRAEFEAGLNEGGVLFNGDAGVGIDVAENPAFALRDGLRAELFYGHLVAPFAEGALGELLDIAFVDQGDGLAARFQSVADGVAHQPLAAEDGNGLDAYT